jgi:hypothetical protein
MIVRVIILVVLLIVLCTGCSAHRAAAIDDGGRARRPGAVSPDVQLRSSRTQEESAPQAEEALDTYEKLIGKRDALGLPETERRRIAAEIGRRVYEKYHDLEYLSFTAHICEPPDRRARAEMRMTPDKLRSEVYIEKYGADAPALVFTLRDGQYQEVSRIGAKPRVVKYPAPFPYGSQDMALLPHGQEADEYGCMLGTSILSWIGPAAAEVIGRLFKEKLACGEFLGTVERDGAKCDVILWEWVEDFHMVDAFYVDLHSLLVQWDSYEADLGNTPRLIRTRRYANIGTDAIPAEVWTFLPDPQERESGN